MVRPAPDTVVDDAMRAAVGHGVSCVACWPESPLSDFDFSRVLQTAMNEGLLGALAQAADDGALHLLPEQLDQLTEHHAGSQAHMLRIERLLLRVAETFADANIDFRVLKGAALAHRGGGRIGF